VVASVVVCACHACALHTGDHLVHHIVHSAPAGISAAEQQLWLVQPSMMSCS
jgi:hypothetical protein